jgi:hypothetical protein
MAVYGLVDFPNPQAAGLRSGSVVPLLIGKKDEIFAGRQILGAAIAVGLVAFIALLRRYLAARAADLSIAQSIGFAIQFWVKKTDKVVPPHGLLVGTDNRVSTSKTTAALWTIILIYFIASMALIFGRQQDKYRLLIQSISPLYLVLLGGPFAAAVLAKGIVSSAVANQQTQKGQGTPTLGDVFSDDDGNTDLIDTQYIAFNILVAAIVVFQFASHPGFGAPVIPNFLAALTGTSAVAYIVNKAVTTGNAPSITQLTPSRVRPEGQVLLYGQNILLQGDDPTQVRVTVGGQEATTEQDPPPTPTSLAFRIQPNAMTGTVMVTTPSGISTPAAGGTIGNSTLTIIPDSIQVSRIDSLSVIAGGNLALHGGGFFNAVDVDWQGSVVSDHPTAANVLLTQLNPPAPPQAGTYSCPPTNVTQSDTQLTVSVPVDVPEGSYRLTLRRGALSYDPSLVVQISP